MIQTNGGKERQVLSAGLQVVIRSEGFTGVGGGGGTSAESPQR